MPAHASELEPLRGSFTVCRLAAGAPIPKWAAEPANLISITRTDDELSIVAPDDFIPADFDGRVERGWSAIRVAGTLDFSEVGILARLTGALAIAQISVFAISTWDTDYLLVKEQTLDGALATLRDAGYTVP